MVGYVFRIKALRIGFDSIKEREQRDQDRRD